MIDRFGRAYELGVASRFYLLHRTTSMLHMGPLGVSMFRHGRMSLRPNRIRRIEQLQAIIAKARELGAGGAS